MCAIWFEGVCDMVTYHSQVLRTRCGFERLSTLIRNSKDRFENGIQSRPFQAKVHQSGIDVGVSERRGTVFGEGPYNEDLTVKGTILGSPIFGKPHVSRHSTYGAP